MPTALDSVLVLLARTGQYATARRRGLLGLRDMEQPHVFMRSQILERALTYRDRAALFLDQRNWLTLEN